MMNDTTPVVITLPDTAAYYSGTTYPTQAAWVVEEGFLEGENHIVTVAVMPFQYVHSASSDLIAQKRTVTVKLRYDLSDTLAMYPIVRNDSLLREEGYQLTRSMVVNPSQVKTYAPSHINAGFDSLNIVQGGIGGDGINWIDPTPNLPDPPDPTVIDITGIKTYEMFEHGSKFPYVIVTTNELSHSLRRLVALKNQKGYQVKVLTMDQVMNKSALLKGDFAKPMNGNFEIAYSDSAGILREFLKSMFQNHSTQYVLFVGNVPYRYVYNWKGFTVCDSVPSDIYYSDLQSYFSSDITKEQFEINPELYVGRLMAKNEEQIGNYTDKLLRYEINPGNGNLSYLKRILYSESLDFQKVDGLVNADRYYNRIFPYKTSMLEDTIIQYPSGTDIIDSINTIKYGYISIMNHAGPSGFITYGHREIYNDDTFYYYLWAIDTIHKIENNEIYTKDPHINNGINNLTNKLHPNICYSIGCTTMPFDKAPDYENILINIGESFTTGKDYGGPAFLGNTRIGYIGGSDVLEKHFANKLSSGYFKLGEAEAFSKMDYKMNPYICKVHNLLGDPEFEMWTDEPNRFDNIEISRIDSTITITGIGEDAALIALCDNDGSIHRFTSSSNIMTINRVSPTSSIMIYRHNYLPFIAPLHIQNSNITRSQYVIASDVYIGNDTSNETVIIKNGVTYELEASGTVVLNNGFIVEKGANFGIYPSCY